MNQNCSNLLRQIYEVSFAMDDIILYLDTHPADCEALNYYHTVANMRRQAMAAYAQQCGPLMLDEVTSQNYWTWVNDPWPWEGGCI